MTGTLPKLRWTVHVESTIQPSANAPNYGDGDTPQEALDALRSRWSHGHDEFQAALRALESAVADAPR